MIFSFDEVQRQILTPAYVFDTDVMLQRIQMVKDLLGNHIKLCYAMKANPFVVSAIESAIDCYEVCSPGEQKICERAGISMDKVVLSGVYKAREDMRYVMDTYGNAITYTAESMQQFQLLHTCAQERGICVRVLLRITSGNQFGMDEPVLRKIIAERTGYPNVDIIGIQHFSGTQRKHLSQYAEELHTIDELLSTLKKETGFEAKQLEFGPGFYVEYFQKEKAYDEMELLSEFGKLIKEMAFQGEITLELGRFLSASCGTYYTKIVDQKRNAGINYCIVDGGMHQMNYFGQRMAMKIPYYDHLFEGKRADEKQPYHICGSLCTVNDHLVKQLPLSQACVGDILAFHNTGAYSMSEGASLFLSRDLPTIYLYDRLKGLQLMRNRFETNQLNYTYIGG